MSADLGHWSEKLTCEMCSGDTQPDLSLSWDMFLDLFGDQDGIPDDFWDEPPEPPEPFDPGDLIPDPYPYVEFPDGGFIFGVKGSL